MAEQGTSRSVSTDALAALTTAQKLTAGLATVKRERDLLENAAKEFAQLFHADYVGMLMAQPDGSGKIMGESPSSTKLDGLTLSPDVRLISEKCANSQIAMVESISDTGLLSQKARDSFSQAKLKALALLPMGDQNGHWIGSVLIGLTSELALDISTVDTASILARQVGSLVLSVRQIERTDQQVGQFTSLLMLSQALGRVQTVEDLGYEVAKTISSVLPLTHFVMLRGAPQAANLDLIARWEVGHAQKIRPQQPVTVDAANTLTTLIGDSDDVVDVPDFSATKPAIQGLLQMATHSGLAAPLRVGGEQIGVVVVESDHIFAYNEADKVIFSQLIAQMNAALTGLSASFGLIRAGASSNAVNAVSQQIQDETSAQGVLRGGTLATLRALKAIRVKTQLGNPTLNGNGSSETYADSNGNGTEKTRR